MARKALGQNFLIDTNITEKIAAAAHITPNDTVLEVGPGIGSLTRYLLKSPAKKIILIEKDPRFLPFLEDLKAFDPERIEIIQGDALTIPLSTLSPDPLTIISNLPYNIGTPLLLQWINARAHVKSLTLMLQKEVVDRLAASPRTKAYGRLTILVEWLMDVKSLFRVPPGAFVPAPKVVSSVVKLMPRKEPLYPTDQAILERLTACVFQQRRKMLRGSLKSLDINTEEVLAQLNISPEARPETLTVEQFCQLANTLAPHLKKTVKIHPLKKTS